MIRTRRERRRSFRKRVLSYAVRNTRGSASSYLLVAALVVASLALLHMLSTVTWRRVYRHARRDFPRIPFNTLPYLPKPVSLVPRISAHTTLSAALPSPARHPAIAAVVICRFEHPCCVDTIPQAVHALFRQTRLPDALTLVHACPTARLRTRLSHVVTRAFAREPHLVQPAHVATTLRDHSCADAASAKLYELCVLRVLAQSPRMPPFDYTLLLSDRHVLEPTAVEKTWLYLTLHPHVSSVRPLAYVQASLHTAAAERDPMFVQTHTPSTNHSLAQPLSPMPILLRSRVFAAAESSSRRAFPSADNSSSLLWAPLVAVLSKGRLLREALYTAVQPPDDMPADALNSTEHLQQHPLQLESSMFPRRDVPAHLFSELSFYKWSSQREEEEFYKDSFHDKQSRVDLSKIPSTPMHTPAQGKRAMFLMPFVAMGGSEKAVLDLAQRMITMNWAVTFVLTTPDWKEDQLGELFYQNTWLNKALHLTSDVINLIALAPNHLEAKAFRYVLESRMPHFIVNSNSRWGYVHSALIRSILPNTVLTDYNHMIHEDWFGGGLPRFSANNSHFHDLHFTSSKSMVGPLEKWIDDKVMDRHPEKVKPCYIGTDPSVFYTGDDLESAKQRQRKLLNISEDATVVLFAGRFILGKGIQAIVDLIEQTSQDTNLQQGHGRFQFVFVGDGEERYRLEHLQTKYMHVLILPPARGLHEMREYYAMSDVLLLPSMNEGIALVLYEAMASQLLVITSDVGGQREVVTRDTGVILPKSRKIATVSDAMLRTLRDIMRRPKTYRAMRVAARKRVMGKFTTAMFCDCMLDGLQKAHHERGQQGEQVTESGTTLRALSKSLVEVAKSEYKDGVWKRKRAQRTLGQALTIGIKTYVCDWQTVSQVRALLRSIRGNYPTVRVLLANDGPRSLSREDFVRDDGLAEEVLLPHDSGISMGRNVLVNMTTTRYFALFDDDHVLDESTDLAHVLGAMERGEFDMVGLRIRNLPGIDELERLGLSIPRYVARVASYEKRRLVLCIWNENEGPSVYGMQDALPVDVLHNAFVAKTQVLRANPWREELKVNEHMSFFLDARKQARKIGYLPSEFVHHRGREYSECYSNVRFREEQFRELLEYDHVFFYNVQCSSDFVDEVTRHMGGGDEVPQPLSME